MNNINKQNKKHIVVTKHNFEQLRKLGFANDSMNDVITKMLEKITNQNLMSLLTLESGSDLQ